MSQQPPRLPLPDDFEEVDFEIVEEHWNEYELSDGNRIRSRLILHKLVRDPNNPTQFSVNASQPVHIVFAPAANRGEKNNQPTPQEIPSLPTVEVRAVRNNEQFNIYRITRNGQTVRLRLTVARINRVQDRFDNDGMPFYVINAGPIFLADPAPAAGQGQ